MLIFFEGIDGVGKSTQIELLKSVYNRNYLITKEPGGTLLGEKLREILLESYFKISKTAELFLFLADRAEHFENVLKFSDKKDIICDRSFVSGIAYALANEQNLDINDLINLNKIALGGKIPNAKFIFLKISKDDLHFRLENRGNFDKIEERGLEYLMKVQKNMSEILKILKIDALEIDANGDINEIHKKIKEFVK